ncbi:hypothetical protein LX32DRAFT_656581 [Colletotrichum zoysiae]|uniref:Uncharacterized protein n=1 Tax=Colletotrichum zoysiae TaxID=1216348 RepID=A0AAD9LWP8_9PEZI|nr:hypothetical protein LX32DRAFT_656581 [Colletotrichum zoysiae]
MKYNDMLLLLGLVPGGCTDEVLQNAAQALRLWEEELGEEEDEDEKDSERKTALAGHARRAAEVGDLMPLILKRVHDQNVSLSSLKRQMDRDDTRGVDVGVGVGAEADVPRPKPPPPVVTPTRNAMGGFPVSPGSSGKRSVRLSVRCFPHLLEPQFPNKGNPIVIRYFLAKHAYQPQMVKTVCLRKLALLVDIDITGFDIAN